MKTVTSLLAILFSITAYCQNGVTFSVENLSKPEKHLRMQTYKDIYESLILSNLNLNQYQIKKEGINVPFNIIANSKVSDSLVNFGYHSFFNGMYQAYADHRPFVLSPDMIWLLISQGFARHVNADPEKMRHYFVDFSGQLSLIVRTETIKLENPNSPWEKVFPEFTKQIGEYTGNDLIQLLSSDFTTTTPVEKVASEITIMEAMKPYFEYIVFYLSCGIPEITLQGKPEDWQKVLDKTKQLKKYDLAWWTDELEPLLEEFVKASKGDVDKDFWRNMFKYHSLKEYGAPKVIDGWIVKFFPYDKKGKRNDLKELKETNDLPEEIVKTDLKYIDTRTGKTTILELWAGFTGLEQNRENYTLTPKIGWVIRKKDVSNTAFKQKLEKEAAEDDSFGGIAIRVKQIPTEIFELKEINSLNVQFIDSIIIPDKLSEIKIKTLELSGKIDEEETQKIKQMFPNTNLIINRIRINSKN